jgi:chromosome partitioning protein
MHTVVIGTQKGGSGKSTLATGLAVAAIESGQRVGMIETDPQGTVSNWGRRRGISEPCIVRVSNENEIERALMRFKRDGRTLTIIDTAPTHNALGMSAIRAADLCLIPARPSPADIEATLPTLDAIRKLGKPFAFVLNQAPVRSFRLSEAATALNSVGVLAFPFIAQRNDHQDALGAGLAVTEFAPDGKAADEIRNLWRWVWKKLTVRRSDHENTPIRAAS